MPPVLVVVLGTRPFSEEIADLVGECDEYRLAGFAENLDRSRCARPLGGHPVYWIDDLPALAGTHAAVCGLGTTRRSRFVAPVEAMGFRFATLRHPRAWVSRASTVGLGTVLAPGVVVAAHTTIGRHVIVNRGALIGHHVEIGDYATISPGAKIAGSCRVGGAAFIGLGAGILDHVAIGTQSVVAAGALVVRDVPDRVEVAGAPARITRRDIEGL